MSIRFQYNKTSLHQLNKQLKMRERALPTLRNKEAALRIEVKMAKTAADRAEEQLQQKIEAYRHAMRLWGEFDETMVKVDQVKVGVRKIAGVKTPVLEAIDFGVKEFSAFNSPVWYHDGIALIKDLATMSIEREVWNDKTRLLDHARRKTTQKVNLYEKVQIPGFQDAIRKIKRYLEDEENLSKASQKIVKNRLEMAEEVV
jgi:V/A-type H+/Na+-transporting ATPase subunit D